MLRMPAIVRTNAAEGAVLLSCTVLVEELAQGLNRPGADEADIEDSLAYLKCIADDPIDDQHQAWIAFLQRSARNGNTHLNVNAKSEADD